MNSTLQIRKLIESNEPFFIGRIAGIELQLAYHHLQYTVTSYHIKELEQNAGIYCESSESRKKYVEELLESYNDCSVIAEWDITGKVFQITGKGQQLISERTPTIPKIDALALEPYYFSEAMSWMPALKGKRILVIHPFVETMKEQLTKAVFPGRSWFEDCEFVFVKPPVTFAGNHQNTDWQQHSNQNKIQIDLAIQSNKKIDITLVAAGGYGMLLSHYLYKKHGISVMYIGGALQLFFGIIGKRWFDNKQVLQMVNDDWTRPSESEKPANHLVVERGCYW